jgi:hypothetical protein
MCQAGHANFAPYALHAHSLWTNLWIILGVAEENLSRPEGNGMVAARWVPVSHSSACLPPARPHPLCTTDSATACAKQGYPQDAPFL